MLLRVLGTVAVCVLSAAETPAAAARLESPRLAAVARELRAGRPEAVQTLWDDMRGGAPLIEVVDGEPDRRWITFLWRGQASTESVDLLGDIPTMDTTKWKFKRLDATDVWLKTEKIRSDARFGYRIRENGGAFQLDPLNPREYAGRSVVELDDAPEQRWFRPRPGVPQGSLETFTLTSRILNEPRVLRVYHPPAGRPRNVLVVFDGESYGARESVVPTPTILDNLLAEGDLEPTLAVFVDSQKTRERDLTCSPAFADFVALELLPWIRRRLDVRVGASHTVVAGSSYGGLAAAFVALRHPSAVGNVVSQSGTFTFFPGWSSSPTDYAIDSGWLTQQFVLAPRRGTRFYLEVGRFEGGPIYDLVRENRRLRDVLRARGYRVVYHEFTGGHDYLTWRDSLADGLLALVGRPSKAVAQRLRSRRARSFACLSPSGFRGSHNPER
jgi:enterochelin esterase family protein